jgi:hypothetical protein
MLLQPELKQSFWINLGLLPINLHRSPTPLVSQRSAFVTSSSNKLYDFSRARIRSEQTRDSSIQNIIKQLQNTSEHHSFRFQDGIFFKILNRSGTILEVPYIPPSLISELLYTHHDHLLSGHFGIERTWNHLRDKYYWPNMKKVIIDYIKSCHKCS